MYLGKEIDGSGIGSSDDRVGDCSGMTKEESGHEWWRSLFAGRRAGSSKEGSDRI